MTFYRDPLAGLRSQIATKRGLLENREQHLPALLRAMLPEELSTPIADLKARALAEPETHEGLMDADAALDDILSAHAEAAELLPRLRQCPDEVPDPKKDENLSPPWIIEETWQLAFRYAFTQRLARIAPDAFVVRWDDTTYLSRLRITTAPIVLSSQFVLIAGQPTSFKSRIRTSVPDETPELEVRRGRMLIDGIGRAVGLVNDVKVGDETFDDEFIVDAKKSRFGSFDGIALLTPDVRSALTAMEVFAPKLRVRRGIADLSWGKTNNNRGEDIMPDAAIAIVLGIRAAIERA